MDGRALLAWNLRRLRAARRLSQERLAADTGIDRSYMSELEREQGNASVDLLDRLAAALEVPISEFFVTPSANETPRHLCPEGADRRLADRRGWRNRRTLKTEAASNRSCSPLH